MANELQPWRYEIKYGPDGEDSYSWVYDDQGVMVAPMRTHKAKEVVDRMNTRPAPVDANPLASNPVDDKIAPDTSGNAPAATDTGLARYDLSMFGNGIVEMGGGAYVRFDQAEELLAAERAEKDGWKELHDAAQVAVKERTEACNSLYRQNTDLEAKLAAKDARIKELDRCHEGTIDLCNQKTAQIETLEAKLAAAEMFIQFCADGFFVTDDELRDAARAALGGKPSC